jgi:ubiquinone/menaquinone biosynthesis C-methylase UbiE
MGRLEDWEITMRQHIACVIGLLVLFVGSARRTAGPGFYQTAAGGEAALAEKLEAAEFEDIATLLQIVDGTIVADIGAGGGAWTFRLAGRVGRNGRVFGTDVRAPQVEGIGALARRRGATNVTAVLGSQQDTGLPDQCCGAMLLRLVFHAFTDAPSMRQSIRRATKAGGLVLVIDFRPESNRVTTDMQASGFERVRLIDRWQDRPDLYALLFRKAS